MRITTSRAGFTIIELLLAVTLVSTLTAWVVGATRDMGRITESNALDVRLARDGRRAMQRLLADLQRTGIRRLDVLGSVDSDPSDDLHFPHVYYDGLPGTPRAIGGREGLDALTFRQRGHTHDAAPIAGADAYRGILGLGRNDPLVQASLILALPADQDGDQRPDMDVLGPAGAPDGVPELDCNRDGVLSQSADDLTHSDPWLGLSADRCVVDERTRLVWSRGEVSWIVRAASDGSNELVRRVRDLRVDPTDAEYPFRAEVVARGVDWLDIKYAEDLQYWDRPEDVEGEFGIADAVVPANALCLTLWMRGVDRQGRAHHYRVESIARLPLGEQMFPE